MVKNSEIPSLSRIVTVASQRLRRWERDVDSLKGEHRISHLTKKELAALFQYNATVRIARLGAEILTRVTKHPREGLLFGLTQRPMFETYTRGLWLERVATEKQARGLLVPRHADAKTRRKTLRSQVSPPALTKMWDSLEKSALLDDVEAKHLHWMRGQETWWNDATHVDLSVWLGWTDESGKAIHDDDVLRYDLIQVVGLAAQSARHIHRIIKGVDRSLAVERIFKELEILSLLLEADDGQVD